MTQTIKGFYEASRLQPSIRAQMTHIVGDGNNNIQDLLTFNGSSIPGISPTNPFRGAQGTAWDNLTFDVSSLMNGDDSSVTTNVTPAHPKAVHCLLWSAIVFSTTVQSSDGDGLLDSWKTSVPIDPNRNPLPNIQAMGALPGQKDFFVEIDYMCSSLTGGVCDTGVGKHTHLPTQAAVDKVGDAFKAKGLHIHFDVGNNYQSDPYVVPYTLARGGDAIPETSCGVAQAPACLFPSYPGTVSWKNGFNLIKNGGTFASTTLPPHFDHARKDIFHYALFAYTLGLPRWRINDKSLTSIVVAPGGVATATVTTGSSEGPSSSASVPITILGAPATSGLNNTYAASVAVVASTSTTLTLTLTFMTGATPGTYQNWGLALSDGTPRSNSGVSDVGGGDLMITLGRWDNFTGSPFMQASTFLHELGHNLDLGHGGDISDPANCKPNYQSSMSYLFQVSGLLDPTGVPHVDYSNTALPTLNETSLNQSSTGLGAAGLAYLPRWYAPLISNFIGGIVGATKATKHCDGTPITVGEQMVRVDGTTLTPTALDWNGDGSLSGSVLPQDINFDGKITAASSRGFQGFNDWMNVNLQQVGARRGASASSLDVGPGQDMGDDLGIAGGDLGIACGDLGIAGGDLGIAGGDLGGELDFEAAKSVAGAPNALTATSVKEVLI